MFNNGFIFCHQMCSGGQNMSRYSAKWIQKNCAPPFYKATELPTSKSEDKETILQRLGFFEDSDKDNPDIEICKVHFEQMTKKFFYLRSNETCVHPDHTKNRTRKKAGQELSETLCRHMLQSRNVLMPVNGFCCDPHKKESYQLTAVDREKEAAQKKAKEEEEKAKQATDSMDTCASQGSGVFSTVSSAISSWITSSQSTKDSQESLGDDKDGLSLHDKLELKKGHFNNILSLDKMDKHKIKSTVWKRWNAPQDQPEEGLSYESKNNVRNSLSSIIASAIHTLVAEKKDDYQVLTDILNHSDKLKQRMFGLPVPENSLVDAIKRYNAANERDDLVVAIASICNHMTLKEIRKFNGRKFTDDYSQWEYQEEDMPDMSQTLDNGSESESESEEDDDLLKNSFEENDDDECYHWTDGKIVKTPIRSPQQRTIITDSPEKEQFDEYDDPEGYEIPWTVPDDFPRFYPPVTERIYKDAKDVIREEGHGARKQKVIHHRERIPEIVLNKIIDFYCNPAIINQVAYGVFHWVNAQDEEKIMPRLIRKIGNTRLVNMVQAYLKSENYYVPHESTLRRILSYCPASQQVAMAGVNPYHAAGMDAFQRLNDVVDVLVKNKGLDGPEATQIKDSITNLHSYYRNALKYQIKPDANCKYHCLVYGLSDDYDPDGNNEFYQECQVEHTEECHHCESLLNLISTLNGAIEQCSENGFMDKVAHRKCVMGVEDSYTKIWAYHGHLLRSICQSSQWSEAAEATTDGSTASCVMDFAMTFDPQKYREPSSDYYGKRGISWHVVVYMIKVRNEKTGEIEKKIQVHVQVLDSGKQDAEAVSAMIRKSIEIFKKGNPGVKKLVLKSDNASAYHCELLLSDLQNCRNEFGDLVIDRYIYSSSGDGKDLCDSFSAIIKREVWKYLHQGGDVVTPEDFPKAMVFHGHLTNTMVFHGSVTGLDTIPEEDESVDEENVETENDAGTASPTTSQMPEEEHDTHPYKCTTQNCTKKFTRESYLINHMKKGKHVFPKKKKKTSTANKSQIHDIKLYHDFEFVEDGIRIRKYSGIGPGKFVPIKRKRITSEYDCSLVMPNNKRIKVDANMDVKYCQPRKRKIKTGLSVVNYEDDQREEISSEAAGSSGQTAADASNGDVVKKGERYRCTDLLCKKKFSRFGDYINHLGSNKCEIPKKHQTTKEYVKNKYFDKHSMGTYDVNETKSGLLEVNLVPIEETSMPKTIVPQPPPVVLECNPGFGQKSKSSKSHFNEKQLSYLHEVFDKGEATSKYSAIFEKTAQDMEEALDKDGEFIFTKNECLKSGQIKALFSRFAKEAKKRGLDVRKTKKAKNQADEGMELDNQETPNYILNLNQPVTEDEISTASNMIDTNERNNIQCEIQDSIDNDVIIFRCPLQVS